jgi:hypothetical protein
MTEQELITIIRSHPNPADAIATALAIISALASAGDRTILDQQEIET